MDSFDPEMDDNGLKKLTDQHMEIVTKEGGSVDNIDIWGRRKLAYEIDGKTEGNYVVVTYSCEPATSTAGADWCARATVPAYPPDWTRTDCTYMHVAIVNMLDSRASERSSA